MATLDDYAKAGIAAINEKRLDDAVENLKKAVELAPERPDMCNALGMAYLHRGEVHTAIPYLEKSIELARPFSAAEHQDMKAHFYDMLATAYELADRIADARRLLEEAIVNWPDKLGPRLQLGQLLLSACQTDAGMDVYRKLANFPALDEEGQIAAQAVVDAIDAYRDADLDANVFLRAHAENYKQYFDEVARSPMEQGWYAEAARMARTPSGEVKPMIAQGARSYAMTRVDLVNPADGSVASVHNEQEPMISAVNGLEPLAQLAIALPWRGWPFEVWVSTRPPWHWLAIAIQFKDVAPEAELIDAVDGAVGDWYLSGFNGDFGDKDTGRFHFVTDPELVGNRAITYTVDLGRARYDAIESLLRRLVVVNEKRAIQRVLFGQARLPD